MGLLREWGSNSPSCKSMSLLPLPPRKSDGRSAGSGAGSQTGQLGFPGDVDVYRFTPTSSGQLTLTSSSPAARVQVFTYLYGLPNVVADSWQGAGRSATGGGGTATADLTANQTYYVRVGPPATSAGDYRFEYAFSPGSLDSADIQPAGKQTYGKLVDSFVRYTKADSDQTYAADQVSNAMVAQFLATLGGPPTTNYLLIWLDPVNYRLSDAQHRESGYISVSGPVSGNTASQGPILEEPGSFFAGSDVLQLLILPRAYAGTYSLDLVGLNADPVLFGARLVTPDGEAPPPSTEEAGGAALGLPVDLALKDSLVAILNFAEAGSPGPPGPPAGSVPDASSQGPVGSSATIIGPLTVSAAAAGSPTEGISAGQAEGEDAAMTSGSTGASVGLLTALKSDRSSESSWAPRGASSTIRQGGSSRRAGPAPGPDGKLGGKEGAGGDPPEGGPVGPAPGPDGKLRGKEGAGGDPPAGGPGDPAPTLTPAGAAAAGSTPPAAGMGEVPGMGEDRGGPAAAPPSAGSAPSAAVGTSAAAPWLFALWLAPHRGAARPGPARRPLKEWGLGPGVPRR